jgi:transposase
MTSRKQPYRTHTREFKLQLCRQIRSGELRHADAQQQYRLSSALIYEWLKRFDRGELDPDAVVGQEASVVAEYQARIADLERMVGQLTMELDLVKKTQRLRLAVNNESSLIISGPRAAPSEKDAK